MKSRSNNMGTKNYYGYFFIAPFVIAFLIFGIYPVVNTVWLSFTDTKLMSAEVNYVELDNFKRLFADDFFMKAVRNTWMIWICNFIPQIGMAMLLAIWFTNQRLKIKGVGIWRSLFFLPNLLMPATIAALFFSILSFYGPANQLLVRAGVISEAMEFLQSPLITRGVVVFIQWWMWFGQTTIILMAGMTAISPTLYEVASVEGATPIQMFTHITLPLLKPILAYIFVTSLIGGMQMFDIPYLLTDGRGSPSRSIMTSNVLMYSKFSSSKGHIGAAAAVGVLIFIMTSICSLGIFYFLREKDYTKSKRKSKS